METKLVRPILIDTKEISQLYTIKDKLFFEKYPTKNVNSGNKKLFFILLDPNQNIEVGDKIYSTLYGLGEIINDYGGIDSERNRPLIAKFENSTTLQEYHRNGIWQKGEHEDVLAHNCRKIIVKQSRIPFTYIQKFIKEYNKNKANVKDVEMEFILSNKTDEHQNSISFLIPKLTIGFVNIIEKYNFYESELEIIEKSKFGETIQIVDSSGNKTKNLGLNKESVRILINWLQQNYL